MCAKARLPLGSQGATKSIGKVLTFYKRGGKQKIRLYHKPTGDATPAQLAQRQNIKLRVESWQALSVGQKAVWNLDAKALGDPWSGYTLFMRRAIMGFLGLEDTPSDYADQAGKIVLVKITEDGLEFGLEIFVSDDTPAGEDGDDGDIWFEY